MSHRRPLRRTLALAVGGLAITAPMLTSCGFRYATDRVYTPAAGTNDRSGTVDVLGAVVVSTRPGEGTLVAGLSNNSSTEEIELQGINPAVDEGVTLGTVPRLTLEPMGYAALGADAIAVSGEYGAGDVLSLSLVFSTGETTTVHVPVVTNCGEFAGHDTAFADRTESPESSQQTSDDAVDGTVDGTEEGTKGTDTVPGATEEEGTTTDEATRDASGEEGDTPATGETPGAESTASAESTDDAEPSTGGQSDPGTTASLSATSTASPYSCEQATSTSEH